MCLPMTWRTLHLPPPSHIWMQPRCCPDRLQRCLAKKCYVEGPVVAKTLLWGGGDHRMVGWLWLVVAEMIKLIQLRSNSKWIHFGNHSHDLHPNGLVFGQHLTGWASTLRWIPWILPAECWIPPSWDNATWLSSKGQPWRYCVLGCLAGCCPWWRDFQIWVEDWSSAIRFS